MLLRCPTCEAQNTPGALECRACGYRLARRDAPFELPAQLPSSIRVESFGPGPATYRSHERAPLRVRHRGELPPAFTAGAMGMLLATGGALFWIVSTGESALRVALSSAVLAGTLYFIVAKMLNHSVIELAAGRLRVQCGPVPWPGSVELAADEIVQIYCDAALQRHVGPPTELRVHVLLRNGERRMLLAGVAFAKEAQLIEDLLEVELGIDEEPVDA